jgi:hypothetical protein
VPRIGELDKTYSQKLQIERILSHEVAHPYFEKRLSGAEQYHFEYYIKERYVKFEYLKKAEKDNVPEKRMKSLIRSFGFTKKEMDALELLKSKEEYYREYYGNDFYREFFGIEAFAIIIMPSLVEKVMSASTLKQISAGTSPGNDPTNYNGSIFDVDLMKIENEKIKQVPNVPERLIPFYIGLFNLDVVTELRRYKIR